MFLEIFLEPLYRKDWSPKENQGEISRVLDGGAEEKEGCAEWQGANGGFCYELSAHTQQVGEEASLSYNMCSTHIESSVRIFRWTVIHAHWSVWLSWLHSNFLAPA